MSMATRTRLVAAAYTVALLIVAAPAAQQAPATATPAASSARAASNVPDERLLARMREYIKKSWTTLSRSNRDLLQALPDPKMPRKPGEPWLLYIAPTEKRERVVSELAA